MRSAVAACLLASASGHGFLAEPKARNVLAGHTCPHCMQSGGPATVSSRSKGTWPTRLDPSSHGLCGDPVQGGQVVDFKHEPHMVAGEVQAEYVAGSIATFKIGVAAHHQGHYEFRICDRPLDATDFDDAEEGQECLEKHLLKRAAPEADCVPNGPADCQPLDENHPERWYLPPPGHNVLVAGEGWQDDAATNTAAREYHTMRFVIPADLKCTRCTIQWYWSTGNTCLYDADYLSYFKNMKSLGWAAEKWAPGIFASWASEKALTCEGSGRFGEEFWNCADISVLASGSDPAPVPAPAPSTPAPAPEPATTPPTLVPATTQAPATPPPPVDGCAQLWGKCGGKGWEGPTCCAAGSFCESQSPWYSQCQPQAALAQAHAASALRGTSRHGVLGTSLIQAGSEVRRVQLEEEEEL